MSCGIVFARTSIWFTAGISNPAFLISSRCFIPLVPVDVVNIRTERERKYVNPLIRNADAPDFSCRSGFLKGFVGGETAFGPRVRVVNRKKVDIIWNADTSARRGVENM
jgi:hypothetical protein